MWGRGRSSQERRETIQVLAPGDALGRYEVIRPLAKGGMAELYLGRARRIEGFEKLVVLKCIRQEYQHEGEFIRMFLDEARLAATLGHPNICQVFDVDRANGRYFFAMEYVDGRDLAAIRKAAHELDGSLALEHVIAIGAGIAGALHYAHELRDPEGRPRAIVHRDVSPSNVLVSYDGAVKLVDFGIARAAGRLTTTRAGTLKGKVRYMSPEQCRGDELDQRSDIFSLGVVLYELTTGCRPFSAEADVALANKIATEDAPRPSSHAPSYPPDLEAIVMRALRRDRNERYATARQLQLDLEQLAADRGLVVSPASLAGCVRRLFAYAVEPAPPVEAAPLPSSAVASRPTKPAKPRRARSLRRWIVPSSLAAIALGIAGYVVLAGETTRAPAAAAPAAPVVERAVDVPTAPLAPTTAQPAKPEVASSPPARPVRSTRPRPRRGSDAQGPPKKQTTTRPKLPEGDDAPLP